ncbi:MULTISPECIES: fasciclin domain-containing protein [unclassified Microbacterium]|uniref:fasciclin domain-containing protein n=1 Tax=unclassified Microbacterium TaxID=2609290 RepID=UPI00214C3E65|nr:MULTISPECIES: fasciclin domain-containing protein [unclassified Microbacterium]MCR2800778.1 fasciclin domain-containing protein [Microbacterium sp. zg.Y818]MCR2825466.1 fasciclin domain-containing protein [Microbacterium sp. zg.Y909]WIM23499.1 fasciclin domain-containing protein [Microbacterium sp. zg-Y818]
MKKKLSITLAAVVATALTLTASPASAYGGPPAGSIVDVAVAASGGGTPDANGHDYDLLVQALVATGLDATLADTSTKYTVFAPNDRAFIRLVTDLTGATPASEAEALTTITSTFSAEQISNILLYHVVPGKKLGPLQVLLSKNITMANGGVIKPRATTLRDETPSLTDPRLVLWAINIQATNGVIHTIDRVLVPAS